MAEQPWHELSPTIVPVLRPLLAEMADEMIEAVRSIPAYARPLEGEFGAGLRRGVEAALAHFLAEVEAGGPVERSDVYVTLGRGEMRAGRSLESLLSAYRAGARVAWRRFSEAGARANLEPDTMYLLAESIFAYIDVLSAESAEGHALEQSAAASEAERRRRRLVRLLVRQPPAEPSLLAAAASEAGWPPPRTLAALAIGGELREVAATQLPPGAIADSLGEITCAIVPDPDAPGHRAVIEKAIRDAGVRAGLGTTVAPNEAPVSFSRARGALLLAEPAHPLVVASEWTGQLLLRSEPGLADELIRQRLAPLEGLTEAARRRLTVTLEVWLAEQGRLGQVASRLSVHPQTARYRINRLRELFGSTLDDPDGRFWLELALRARDARSAAHAPGSR